MRVAFLTHEPFYPPSGGGSAEVIYLVREMIQRGHEVHLFCPAFHDPNKVQRLFAAEDTTGIGRKPTPASREGRTPDPPVSRPIANLQSRRWQRHCRGFYKTPIAT